MKRLLVAAIVGGIIIFFWQFLSNAALDLHRVAQQYTPKQDTIMSVLRSNLAEGRYFIPTTPENATTDEEMKLMGEMEGKDWAIVDYHTKWETTMVSNMVRGLLVDILMVYLLGWILTRGGPLSFRTIFLSSLFVGLIAFFNFPYSYFIWYKSPGVWIDLLDAVMAWGLNGAWLGWYLNRK